MLNPSVKAFVKVAEKGSFSAAAEQLYISKVSVMNQINALEAEMGVPLFERTNHGVALTEAGKSVYKNAKKLLRLEDNTIREARRIGGADKQIIRVGSSMMRPCNILVDVWEQIEGRNPNVQFDIVPFSDGEESLNTMLKALGDTVDCFVTPCGSMKLLTEYNFLPFGTQPCAVAMSKKHPLAKKEALTWKDLEGQSLLLVRRGESYVLDELRDDILCNHKATSIVDFDGYYDISAFNLCEQQGYLMETLDMWSVLHPSLATVPVQWKYEMPYGILYAKKPSHTVKEFVDVIAASTVR